ncbi:queuosine precursor transporter [Legionella feeleii]|uniref:Queuosine precursor transporter n=1 Tax=Legionella feeleii TaxID=453 RepID=A0A0W0U5D1_9GAMM|nr:queuosine precursor transporter [Legionella feeleii]KTD02959.1 hypothetical protein Lfee_0575 [Legionella feeleii]SPX62396.1 conserved hypothetical integral membrane protein [Legionella feeleii]
MSSVLEKLENKILPTNQISEYKTNFRYIRIIAMIYLTFLLAATVVAYKIVIVGYIPEPGSTLIYTCSFFLSNVYTEVYGVKLSKKLVWESIGCGYLFALLLTGINLLPTPDYWDNTDIYNAYNTVLSHVLRFTNAGVIGYLISSFLNVYLIGRWKYKMKGKLFWLRSLLASSISEGAATFIAGLITFVGLMPTKKIVLLMLSALTFKIVYGFIVVWPASLLAYLLKKKEQILWESYNCN